MGSLGCIINIFVSMNSDYLIAIQAAVDAGKRILEVYEKDDFGIEYKTDESPLTIADKKAHEIISDAVSPTAIPMMSEEGKGIDFEERRQWAQFWLVDPLDGTKEFIKRNGEFTVNIALVKNGKTIFGVVYAPVINSLYFGMEGEGAFLCRDESYFGKPLDMLIQYSDRLPENHNDDQYFRVVASRSHYNEETETYVNSLDNKGKELKLVNQGSSLKLCLVASGEADVYPRLGPTMEWDTAAAHAVVKAAGKNVFRVDTGEELEYNKKNLLNPFFVVR